MGFRLSWVAVHDSAPDAVYADLGFRRTGKFEEFPESPFCGTASKTGWTLVVMNRSSAALDGTVDLARLSKLGDVVACFVEEHVMCSAAACWSSGKVTWSVVHESSKGMRDLQATGVLPASFDAAVKVAEHELAANGGDQSDVDYHFDVPVELAKSIAGFRHDEDGEFDQGFEVLQSEEAKWKEQRR